MISRWFVKMVLRQIHKFPVSVNFDTENATNIWKPYNIHKAHAPHRPLNSLNVKKTNLILAYKFYQNFKFFI